MSLNNEKLIFVLNNRPGSEEGLFGLVYVFEVLKLYRGALEQKEMRTI
jgi:hypothetical protein